MVQEFFTHLEHYIESHPEIPKRHKSILKMYSDGLYIKTIAEILKLHRWSVYRIIQKYKAVYPPTLSTRIDKEL